MNEHYAAVLADLRERKTKLEAEIQEVSAAITAIQRLMGTHGHATTNAYPVVNQPHTDASTRFANISVRWGVLWQLYDSREQFQKTGEIAAAILAGGYKSEAGRFGNLVSAVISGMKAKGEVETNEDGGYRLTEQGRTTWELIRRGTKFRAAMGETTLPMH